jgi:hypothetical protein
MVVTQNRSARPDHRHLQTIFISPLGTLINITHNDPGTTPHQRIKLLKQQFTKMTAATAINDNFGVRAQSVIAKINPV